jgi:hypothetical protein
MTSRIRFLRLVHFAAVAVSVLTVAAVPTPAPAASSEPSVAQPRRANRLVPAVCFAPGTPAAKMEKTTEQVRALGFSTSLDDPQAFQFNDGDRWTQTATDGSGLVQGDPTTLTWSIVPDGTPIFGYIGEASAPSNLQAFLTFIYGNEATWLALFQRVFDRWSELSGITYVYEPNDDGSAWTQFSIAGGQLGVRGDIRISGHTIDGTNGVLAYTFFPNSGDMIFDTSDGNFTFTGGDSLLLRNTVAHEHGHGLGLSHVCPLDDTKLMEPILSLSFDGPQHDDVLAAQRGYGDRFEHNDTPGTATDLGAPGAGSVVLGDVSVDDNGDGDLYRLHLGIPGRLDATLSPVGFTYLSGPQNPNGSCSAGTSFNSLTVHDLRLRVLDGSLAPLATVDATGAGAAEVLSGLTLPAVGDYFLEVTGDTSNAAQLYRLDFSLADLPAIFTDGFEEGDTSGWSMTTP